MKILRTKKFRILVALIGIAFLSIACSGNDDKTDGSINPVSGSTNIGLIDDARILEAESEPGNWLAHGRTYEEQRFSPLSQINKETVLQKGKPKIIMNPSGKLPQSKAS